MRDKEIYTWKYDYAGFCCFDVIVIVTSGFKMAVKNYEQIINSSETTEENGGEPGSASISSRSFWMRERTPDLRKMPTASGAERARYFMALTMQQGSGSRPQEHQPRGAPNTRRRRLEPPPSPSKLGRGSDLDRIDTNIFVQRSSQAQNNSILLRNILKLVSHCCVHLLS